MSSKDAPQAAKPKKTRWYKQITSIYTQARAVDKAIGWWMLLAAAAVLVVGIGIGALLDAPVFATFLSVPLALLAATIVLTRRAERAAYRQIEGQPGAAGAALSSIRRGWYLEEQPVAAEVARGGDVSAAAVVFRALGRAGVVLVAEGPEHRAKRLLLQEKKKVERVAPGVPVIVLRVGEGGGDDVVPVRKLAGRVQRMKPVLTKDEVSAVNKRLKSLGGMRMPVPPGMDPKRARVDRKALRGR